MKQKLLKWIGGLTISWFVLAFALQTTPPLARAAEADSDLATRVLRTEEQLARLERSIKEATKTLDQLTNQVHLIQHPTRPKISIPDPRIAELEKRVFKAENEIGRLERMKESFDRHTHEYSTARTTGFMRLEGIKYILDDEKLMKKNELMMIPYKTAYPNQDDKPSLKTSTPK